MKKVLLVSAGDPRDKKKWSGTENSLYQLLNKYYNVEILIVSHPKSRMLDIYRMKILTFGKQTTRFGFLNSYMCSKIVQKKLKQGKYDVAFVFGSYNISFLRTKIPIVYYTDSTVHNMQHYQWEIRWPLSREADVIQRKCLEKSTVILASSMWVIRDIVEHYGIDSMKCKLCRLGANAKIEYLPTHKNNDAINIVFVGTNWINKGGDVAIEAFHKLRTMDEKHHYYLQCVGSRPDREVEDNDIKFYGFLDRNDPEQEQKLGGIFRNGDIFLLPTKMECAGIVFCEASAFGMPIVTYDTGGISDYVINGVNGYRLPPNSSGQEFANEVLKIVNDTHLRERLSEGGKRLYKDVLNWEASGYLVKEVIDSLS